MFKTASPNDAFRRFLETRSPEALGLVFDQLAPALHRYAVGLGVDAAAAEDLVQATFLAVIEEDIDFQACGNVESYLRGILRYRAQRLHKARSRSPDPARVRGLNCTENPLDSTVRAELTSEVREAVDALPRPYRNVVDLHLCAGMQPVEIARHLGLRSGTVRMQLKRGLENLKKRLPAGLSGALVTTIDLGEKVTRERTIPNAGGQGQPVSWPLILPHWLPITVTVLIAAGSGLWMHLTEVVVRGAQQDTSKLPTRPPPDDRLVRWARGLVNSGNQDDLVKHYPTLMLILDLHAPEDPVLWEGVRQLVNRACDDPLLPGRRLLARRLLDSLGHLSPPEHLSLRQRMYELRSVARR